MIRRTPYNILNLSSNSKKQNNDEEIFKKFVRMIEWIEDEKLRQLDYDGIKNKNINYDDREKEYVLSQSERLRLLQMQEDCIDAYRKIATEFKRYEYDKRKNENFREQYKVENQKTTKTNEIDAYELLGITDKEHELIRREDQNQYDDEIKQSYRQKLEEVRDEIYKIIQSLNYILQDEIFFGHAKVTELQKPVKQNINRLEKYIIKEEEIIQAYLHIANSQRRSKYNIEKNSYDVDLWLASLDTTREDYVADSIWFKHGKKEVLELIPVSKILYERGIENKKSSLTEYILKRYNNSKDKNGNDIMEFLGQDTIYTENDIATMLSVNPELSLYIQKYLLSPENIEKSKQYGNYVGLIHVKNNQFTIVREKSASRIAKKVQRDKQVTENIEQDNSRKRRIKLKITIFMIVLNFIYDYIQEVKE